MNRNKQRWTSPILQQRKELVGVTKEVFRKDFSQWCPETERKTRYRERFVVLPMDASRWTYSDGHTRRCYHFQKRHSMDNRQRTMTLQRKDVQLRTLQHFNGFMCMAWTSSDADVTQPDLNSLSNRLATSACSRHFSPSLLIISH